MANTRADCPHIWDTVFVSIPNKISKRFGDRKKKTRAANPWAILAAFNPKKFWDMMEKMNGRRKQYRF